MILTTRHNDLSTSQHTAVARLAAKSCEADHVRPLNEAAELALAGRGSAQVVHWLASTPESSGQILGYAQLDLRDHCVQLVVDPDFRRRGIGTELASRVQASDAPQSWWAFGNLPPAQALAASLGLVVIRGLFIMKMDLDAFAVSDLPALPQGITLDHYQPSDLERLVQVNAAAFAAHPEQGALTSQDFQARMDEPWYTDSDLLVARDATGQLVGYHWTKVEHGRGEVYVIGVHPELDGQCIGRALLQAGITHMRERGALDITLYVEASNDRVVQIYQKTGFAVASSDMSYGYHKEN